MASNNDNKNSEIDLYRVFENTTKRNVEAVVTHSNKTRELVRGLENEVKILDERIREQDKTIQNLRLQLSNIQTKVYSGGT